MDKKKILILSGDGVGPEAVKEVKKIIEWLLALLLIATAISVFLYKVQG